LQLREWFRDRFSALSRGELTGLVAIVAVTLAGAGFWYVRSLPRPVEITAEIGSPQAAASAQAASPSPSAPLIVDVAGWVRRPGVYELAEGDRVIDALEAAGGARKGAILAGINLAAPVQDGQQVLVPDPSSAEGEGPATGTGAGSGPAASGINVNTADEAELEELSGIGEVLAAAIVEYREKNGPFESVDQLEEVSGIGPATLEEIRNDVTV
jgi:competence protein ComEA